MGRAHRRTVSEGDMGKIDLLRGVVFFKPLDDDVLETIAEAIHEVTFAPGTRFITQGQVDDAAFLIVDGQAEVSTHSRRIRTLGPGSIVGEMAAVSSRPRTASVTATSEVRAYVLTGAYLRDLMRDHPNMAAVLSREMAFRVG
jgi:CRP/FNR family transcriptional regulator, cyclic AMP receptor protein